MLLLLLFGLSSEHGETETGAAVSNGDYGRAFVGGTVLLAVCALLAISHQSWRYVHSQATKASGAYPSPPTRAGEPRATESSPRQIGPFTVGQTLAATWSVDALALSDAGFIVTLRFGTDGARPIFSIPAIWSFVSWREPAWRSKSRSEKLLRVWISVTDWRLGGWTRTQCSPAERASTMPLTIQLR